MASIPIKILKGYPNTGKLELFPSGTVPATPTDNISWTIDAAAGVDSIVSIERKFLSREIFSSHPGPLGGREWGANINRTIRSRITYRYSILWNATPDQQVPYKYDPKIAVRPPNDSSFLIKLVMKIALAVFVMLGVSKIFLGTKKGSK